jgi:hypothetical protein
MTEEYVQLIFINLYYKWEKPAETRMARSVCPTPHISDLKVKIVRDKAPVNIQMHDHFNHPRV